MADDMLAATVAEISKWVDDANRHREAGAIDNGQTYGRIAERLSSAVMEAIAPNPCCGTCAAIERDRARHAIPAVPDESRECICTSALEEPCLGVPGETNECRACFVMDPAETCIAVARVYEAEDATPNHQRHVYEPCVLGVDGQCTRWSHDHDDAPPAADTDEAGER